MASPLQKLVARLKNSGWQWTFKSADIATGMRLQKVGSVRQLRYQSDDETQVRINANLHLKRPPHPIPIQVEIDFGEETKKPNFSTNSDYHEIDSFTIAVVHEFITRLTKDQKAMSALKSVKKENPVESPLPSKAHYLLDLFGDRLRLTVTSTPSSNALPSTEDAHPEDHSIFSDLKRLGEDTQSTRFFPQGKRWKTLLSSIIDTKRCFWKEPSNEPFTFTKERLLATPVWKFDRSDNAYHTSFECSNNVDALLPFSPPWFVDPDTQSIGEIDSFLPDQLAFDWLSLRKLDVDEVQQMNATLTKKGIQNQLPLPPERNVQELKNISPKPVLHFQRVSLPRNHMRSYWSPVWVPLDSARLEFDYDGYRAAETTNDQQLFFDISNVDGGISRIFRDLDAENEYTKELNALGLFSIVKQVPKEKLEEDLWNVRNYDLRCEKTHEAAWTQFLTEDLTALKDRGWTAHFDDSFTLQIVEPEEWHQHLESANHSGSFEFRLSLTIDGESVDLLPALIRHLQDSRGRLQRALEDTASDQKIPIPLPSGKFVALPKSFLKPLLETLVELHEGEKVIRKDGSIQLHRLRAAELTKATRKHLPDTNAKLARLADDLANFEGIEAIPLPVSLKATLRPYQEQGYHWLQFLRRHGLCGILADDMGLGKTIQTLCHILREHEEGRLQHPVLIVCPTSLLSNWIDETNKFAPSIRIAMHYGTSRQKVAPDFSEIDVIVTSYGCLSRDIQTLGKIEFSMVILDEAQAIKNPLSQAAQAACQIQAPFRLALSGTPIENHLEEMWSLFHFLLPGFLGHIEAFRRIFRKPIEKENHVDRGRLLSQRISPFILRRKKVDVVSDLPAKTEMIQRVQLHEEQRELYENIRISMEKRVQETIQKTGISRSQIVILDALLKLRQICCDPRLLSLEAAEGVTASAKLDLLMEMLPKMISEGRRILLFSQFTSMLSIIEDAIREKKIAYAKLTGQTRNRPAQIKKFQDGTVPLFLISLKAGGTGLNLTAADTVIHYDPWWNPASEAQATDRAHRIGQDKPVFVYKLFTIGTIEEKILAMQNQKKELVENLLEGSTSKKGQKALSPKDLENLLMPLAPQ